MPEPTPPADQSGPSFWQQVVPRPIQQLAEPVKERLGIGDFDFFNMSLAVAMLFWLAIQAIMAASKR